MYMNFGLSGCSSQYVCRFYYAIMGTSIDAYLVVKYTGVCNFDNSIVGECTGSGTSVHWLWDINALALGHQCTDVAMNVRAGMQNLLHV